MMEELGQHGMNERFAPHFNTIGSGIYIPDPLCQSFSSTETTVQNGPQIKIYVLEIDILLVLLSYEDSQDCCLWVSNLFANKSTCESRAHDTTFTLITCVTLQRFLKPEQHTIP